MGKILISLVTYKELDRLPKRGCGNRRMWPRESELSGKGEKEYADKNEPFRVEPSHVIPL